jgi:hypothetical protein
VDDSTYQATRALPVERRSAELEQAIIAALLPPGAEQPVMSRDVAATMHRLYCECERLAKQVHAIETQSIDDPAALARGLAALLGEAGTSGDA